LNDGANCTTGVGLPGPDCFGTGSPSFYICGHTDDDDTVNVALKTFCTTDNCVGIEQAKLSGGFHYEPDVPAPGNLVVEGLGQLAVPVPFSAASDGRDHWLSAGEPHCADCHAAPYVEQSGNVNFFPPFNYPQKASLFRYSRGHQDITCQGCHESIHGLYPVTPPGYVLDEKGDPSTKAVDQTSWDQAAGMNTDGSHGPLKCGACHDANSEGVNKVAGALLKDPINGDGSTIGQDYDAAVTWMHTYTDEADPRDYLCTRCHTDNRAQVLSDNGKWNSHAKQGRVSRASMDKAEILQLGHVAGAGEGEDPLSTVCTSCHGDRSDKLPLVVKGRKSSGGCTDGWKNHLVEGRVSESVWEQISLDEIGETCGW
jgi:hypothetical protein